MESSLTKPRPVRDSDQVPDPKVENSKRALTFQKRMGVLGLLCLGCILQGATYSHFTPFFDRYAQQVKKLTSVQYGIIMGAYGFVMVIVQPITAKVASLDLCSDRMLLYFGWAVDGTFCLLMSFLQEFGQGYPFFIGSLVARVCQAFGDAVGLVMLNIIIGSEMNDINHVVLPIFETVHGVSVVIGPAVSGVLFDRGGFPLPFLAIGGTLLLVSILSMCLFPNSSASVQEEPSESVELLSAWKFPVIVNLLCVMNAYALVSSNEATLALRLNSKFGSGASESGLLFLFGGGFYALTGFLFGFLSKRVNDPRYFVLFGQCLTLVALTLQAPLIPISQTKTDVILAQILLGAGCGPVFVCSYIQSLNYLSGGENTRETYIVASSVFDPAMSLGCVMGSLMAGMIRHYFSYETLLAVNVAQTALLTVLLFITTCSYSSCPKKMKP